MQQYNDISILLVEDDDIDAKAIERALKKLKVVNPLYRVKNGFQALQVLKGETTESDLSSFKKPYIILLDLNMPVMGGIEFLQKMRQDEEIQDSIVFVLTTSSADEDRVAAYKEHIAGYMVKSDVSNGFMDIVDMLDHYWRVIVLPGQ